MSDPYQSPQSLSPRAPLTTLQRAVLFAPLFFVLSLGHCTYDYSHWGGEDFEGFRSTYLMGVPHFVSYQDLAWTADPGIPRPEMHTGLRIQWVKALPAVGIALLAALICGWSSHRFNPTVTFSLKSLPILLSVTAPPVVLGFLAVLSPKADDMLRALPFPIRLLPFGAIPCFVCIAAYSTRRYFSALSYSILALAVLWWSAVMSRVIQSEHLSPAPAAELVIFLIMLCVTWGFASAAVFLANRSAHITPVD